MIRLNSTAIPFFMSRRLSFLQRSFCLSMLMLIPAIASAAAAANNHPIFDAYQQSASIALPVGTPETILSGSTSSPTDTGAGTLALILHGYLNVRPANAGVGDINYSLVSSTTSGIIAVDCQPKSGSNPNGFTNSDFHRIDGAALNISQSTQHTVVGQLLYGQDIGTATVYYALCATSDGGDSIITYSSDSTPHRSSNIEVVLDFRSTATAPGIRLSKIIPNGNVTITADGSYHLAAFSNVLPTYDAGANANDVMYEGLLEVGATGSNNLRMLGYEFSTVVGSPSCTGDACCGLGTTNEYELTAMNLPGGYSDYDATGAAAGLSSDPCAGGSCVPVYGFLCVKGTTSGGPTDTFTVAQSGSDTGTGIAMEYTERMSTGSNGALPCSLTTNISGFPSFLNDSWQPIAHCTLNPQINLGTGWQITTHGALGLTYSTGLSPAQVQFNYTLDGAGCNGSCSAASGYSVDHTIMPNDPHGEIIIDLHNDLAESTIGLNGATCGALFDGASHTCELTISASLNHDDVDSSYSPMKTTTNLIDSLYSEQ